MAELRIEGDQLLVELSRLEKLEAVHRNVTISLADVICARAVENPWPELRGVRAPGTGIPRVISVGTRRGAFGKDFAVVHGAGQAVVVECNDQAPYHRLVVTIADADAVADRIHAARIGTAS